MSLPSYNDVDEPLLYLLYTTGGEEHCMLSSETYGPLADFFDLTEEDRKKTRHDVFGDKRRELAWANMVQWARRRLKDAGLLDKNAGRGVWKLSIAGIEHAKTIAAGYDDTHFISTLKNQFPEEVGNKESFKEGATRTVKVNAYERNPKARKMCIEHFGVQCAVCDLKLADFYGEVAKDLIHVHHLKPLSEVGAEYTVDPVEDLRPVCPNCHAVIHLRKPPYSVEEMKKMLRRTGT